MKQLCITNAQNFKNLTLPSLVGRGWGRGLKLLLLFIFLAPVLYAQPVKVNGVVISAKDKEPVIGASIKVKENLSIVLEPEAQLLSEVVVTGMQRVDKRLFTGATTRIDAVDVSADQLSSGDAITLISSAIAGLNADDIADFQILKDGSATSIYGARAMNTSKMEIISVYYV
jgi:hypothetical protein